MDDDVFCMCCERFGDVPFSAFSSTSVRTIYIYSSMLGGWEI